MAPDSESAAALLESFVTLAEEKHSEEWIRRAKDAAHLLSSWVVSYQYVFPEDSEFGRLAINTTGAVFANAQNKHAAPGLCTCSGDALYRLYKLTGDRAYLELCRDIAAFIPQTVSTSVRPIHDREKGCPMPEGWINERVNMSDWEGVKFVGGVFYGTCWCTTAFMCTCADLLPIKELDLIDATDELRAPIRLNVSAGDSLGLVRDRIRSLSDKEKTRGVEVVLAPGEYCLSEGLSLTVRDGGCSPAAPVVWRAERPGSVRVLGGRRVPSSRFHPVVEREVCDRLPSDAIARVRVAEVEDLLPDELAAWPDSFAGVSPPPAVFAFGKPSRPARWPNEDWCVFDKPVDRGKLVQGDPGIGVYRNGAFVFSDERPRRWDFSKGVWLNGYWTHDWYNRTVRAGSWGSEDGTNDVLRLAGDVQYGVMGGTWGRKKRRFRACNLLEELDDPGEHWLDRKRKLLYVMPLNGEVSPGDEIVLAASDQDLVRGEGVCNLRIEGISFECNYGMLVCFEGVTNIVVADCRFVNTARSGVSVAGVSNSVVRCEVFNCGESGVGLHGGDRRRLFRSDSLVEDCHIHDFGLFKRTYAPGISVSGIGHTVRGNEIDHAPHQAVGYHGNDILFEFNDVHHVLMETGDSGAFYTGRDWTTAGNVLRYNFVHEIGSPGCDVNVMGFYFDDCDCGDEVYGNVFWKVPRGILIGGGREHPVRNNIFAECEIGVSIDDRGLTWEKWNTPVDGWDLEAKAVRIGYDKEPWQSRYPRLARIMSDSPREPLYNPIEENVFVDCPGRYVWLEGPQMSKVLPKLTVTNNVAYASVRQVRKTVKDDRIATGFDIRSGEAEPGFENARGGDFRLRAGADVVRVLPGVGSLPLARICRNTLSRVHKTQNKKGRKHE